MGRKVCIYILINNLKYQYYKFRGPLFSVINLLIITLGYLNFNEQQQQKRGK